MKKIVLSCVVAMLLTLSVKAQEPATRPTVIKSPVKKTAAPVLKAETPATQPPPSAPPPPSTPAPPPAPAQTTAAPVYKLTSVRLKITTGRDNKESPSEVYAKFSLPEQFSSSYCAFARWNLQNEMPVNAETEIGLDKKVSANLSLISTKLTMSNPEQLRTGAKDITLTDIQQHGGRLMIKYYPHLFTDAWRIENVTLMLEFKDQNGNPHPVHGSKTLSFSNARTFLNAGNERYLVCDVGTDITAMGSYTRN